ncbi:hybrid sensor histidine kinase/response regulator [Egbenema bharatensis]|uniref:hybrid sensor histidine kinase/response regulator n=1 Tax=Egbenema bharatensis TaxID=3463334 RepID=UPI003A8C76A4
MAKSNSDFQGERSPSNDDSAYRRLFEVHPEPMWVYALETLQFLAVNQAAINHYGYTRDEFLSMTLADISLSADGSALQEYIPTEEMGLNHAGVQPQCRADGSVILVDIMTHILEFGGQRAAMVIARDVTQQRQTEAKAQESKYLSQLAGRIARLGGWSVDLLTQQIQWSPQVYAIHEVPLDSPAPVLTAGIDFYPPEYRDRIRHLFMTCAEQGIPYDEELQIITAKGRRIWVRTIGEPVRDENGTIVKVQGAFQDITEKKHAEQALIFSQQQVRLLAESLPQIVWTAEPDGTVDYANAAFYDYLGENRNAHHVLQNWSTYLHPDDVEACITAWQTAVNSGNPYWVEFRVRSRAGEYRWHLVTATAIRNESGQISKWYGTGLDIHDRRLIETQLRESEARFRAVARATADVIWDWNLRDNTVWWNEGFQTVFGYSSAEIEPGLESWTRRVHPDELDRVMTEMNQVFKTHQSVWEGEYRFLHKNGSWKNVSDRGYLIFDDDGQPVRFVGGMTDITERLLLEEKLRQSQRLEAIGQLTGGVAHDFNNLLTVILGNTDLLAEQLKNSPNLHILAEMTQSAAQQGADLTHRLLAFARRQALTPQVVNVNSLLTGIDPLLRRTLTANIAIELVQGGGLWNCLIDRVQLETALLNLCLNARDAMPNGGKLTLETANAHLDYAYAEQHPEVTAGQYVLIAITDTGTGISPEHLHQVFDPFFTTKAAGKGTGLGLSMVYGFVKQSGGHIKLYSELGDGTTVKLYLPRVLQAESSPVLDDMTGILRGSETILVVEDNDLVRSYVETQLRSLGYRVIAVQTGDAAFQVIHQDPTIDLLFTDVMMPGGMNGKQLADRVRKLRPELKVLYTSGYTENAIVHQGRLDPGVLLLSKPYRLRDLARMVRQALMVGGIT